MSSSLTPGIIVIQGITARFLLSRSTLQPVAFPEPLGHYRREGSYGLMTDQIVEPWALEPGWFWLLASNVHEYLSQTEQVEVWQTQLGDQAMHHP